MEEAEQRQYLRVAQGITQATTGLYQLSHVLQKFLKKSSSINYMHGYLDSNNLLNTCQSGFRPFHSTLTALLEATSDWSMNIDNGLINGVVFIFKLFL